MRHDLLSNYHKTQENTPPSVITPETRLNAYKYAKERITEWFPAQKMVMAICAAIWAYTTLPEESYITLDDIPDEFPELLAYKPDSPKVYWWPQTKEGQAARLAALDDCIAKVKLLIHEPNSTAEA